MEHTHHVMDYIEISVVDVAAAKRFYSEAFGWSFNDYGDEYAAAVEARPKAASSRRHPTIPGVAASSSPTRAATSWVSTSPPTPDALARWPDFR